MSKSRNRKVSRLWARLLPLLLIISFLPDRLWLPAQAQPAKRAFFETVQRHNLTVELIGDGHTTSQCELVLTNPLTHKSSRKTIKTHCVSRKTMRSPATADEAHSKNLQYRAVANGAPEALSIARAARSLDAAGKFDGVPIPSERRLSTVTQLAIWQSIGGKEGSGKDVVNEQSILADMLSKSGIDPKSLSSAEKRQLKSRVDLICDAVDLTCKQSHATDEPPKKDDEPLRTATGDQPPTPGTTSKPDVPPTGNQPTTIPVKAPNNPSHTLVIPPGTTFVPTNGNESEFQDMMTDDDEEIDDPDNDNDDGVPPVAKRPYDYVNNPKCYCVAGRMVIVAGPFNAGKPGESFCEPSDAQADDQELTERDLALLKDHAKEDLTIAGSLAWAKQLQGNHLHKVAFNSSSGAISTSTPYTIGATGKWVPKTFSGGDQAGIIGAEKLLSAGCPTGQECCYYEEVLVLMHGSQESRNAFFQRLPTLTGGKPIKKLVLWMCNSTDDLKPGETNYKNLGALMAPQSCPCACTKDACNTFDPDCPNTGKCPHGEPTKVITSWQVNDHSVPLGIDPGDTQTPFASPTGVVREITVTGDSMDVQESKMEKGTSSHPYYKIKKTKDGKVVGRLVQRKVTVSKEPIFMCLKSKSDPTLVPVKPKTPAVTEAELKKPQKPQKPDSPLPAPKYAGPKCTGACDDGSGCHPKIEDGPR